MTDTIANIHPLTLRSLRRHGWINSINQIMSEGIDIICPNAPQIVISPEIEETRKVQDELIAIIEKNHWSLTMPLSRDMPPEITGIALVQMVFPAYLSDLKRMVIQLEKKQR